MVSTPSGVSIQAEVNLCTKAFSFPGSIRVCNHSHECAGFSDLSRVTRKKERCCCYLEGAELYFLFNLPKRMFMGIRPAMGKADKAACLHT